MVFDKEEIKGAYTLDKAKELVSKNVKPTLLVAHLHFLQTYKPTLKIAKELPSQRTTSRQRETENKTRKDAAANIDLPYGKEKVQG